MSDKKLFKAECKLGTDNWVWELPSWFDQITHHGLAVWVVAVMERQVWRKFNEAKAQSKRKAIEWKLGQDSLLYKEGEILAFWKSLEQTNRRKVF